MKKVYKEHRVIVQICMFLYIIFMGYSIYSDINFFVFSYEETTSYFAATGNPHALAFYLILKCIFAVLFYIFFRFIIYCWVGVVEHNQEVRLKLIFYGSILLVYVIVLAHVYPGIWWCNGHDEFNVFLFARHLQVQYHQGVLAAVVYILALMCYPSPVMVVLFQVVTGTIVLGNIAYDLYCEQHKSAYWFILLILSPATLYYTMYPMRAYLFSVFFLAFIHYYIKVCQHRYTEKKYLYLLTFLMCIVINYRTEAKFLLVLYPFLLCRHFNRKMIIRAELIAVCSVFIASGLNTLGFQRNNKAHNSLMVVAPISLFLTDDSRDKTGYEQDIINIDKVLNVEMMIEKAGYALADGERSDREYTDEDLTKYYKSALKIIAKNPDLYFKSKIKSAMDSLGMSKYSSLGYKLPEEVKPEAVAPYFADADRETHDLFAKIIAGQYKFGKVKMYHIFYALWLPCILLLAVFLTGLKKQRSLAVASAVIGIHLILTIFTAPTRYQMYYYAQYLAGWYLAICACRYLPAKIFKTKN